MDVIVPLIFFLLGIYWIVTWFTKKGDEAEQKLQSSNWDSPGTYIVVRSPLGNTKCTSMQLGEQIVKLAISNFDSEIEAIKSLSQSAYKLLEVNIERCQILSMTMHIALLTHIFNKKIELPKDYYNAILGQFNKQVDVVSLKLNGYLAEMAIDDVKAVDAFICDFIGPHLENELLTTDFLQISTLMRSMHLDTLKFYEKEFQLSFSDW